MLELIYAKKDREESEEWCKDCEHIEMCAWYPFGGCDFRLLPKDVRHGESCEYCKGRAYSKKPLTVITRTMKRVEVCFNFCPNCGRDMRVTDTNVSGKGGTDNG